MKIKVRVIPRAKKERIEEANGIIRVYTSKPPIEGKANKHLIEMLARYLNIRKNAITIMRGLKSRDKIIEINEPNRK